MRKLILALALLFLAGPAMAQATHGFDLSWIDPTERVDGMEFDPATEIALYRAECMRVGDAWEDAAFVEFTRGQTGGINTQRQYAWENAVQRGGWYDCRMLVRDTSDLSSDWSAVVRVRKLARPASPVWY